MVAYLQKSEGSEGFHQIVDFLTTSHIRYALTESPTISVSLIEQFWQTATASTLENGDMEIISTIDGKVKNVSKASIRRHLKLEDSEESFQGIYWGGHSIVSNNACLRDFIRHETEVLQPSSPTQTHVADEAASIGVDDRHGGAATTVSGLEAGQDSDKCAALETYLKQTKKVYGDAFARLIKKVKKLEKTVKTSQARRRLRVVTPTKVSAKGEAHTQQDQPEDYLRVHSAAKVLADTSRKGREVVNVQSYTRRRRAVSTGSGEISTGSGEISTAKESVSTAGASMPVSTAGMV
ncbi:hypothetical protein Tco_1379441 [Tanacetum coccineum]